MIAIGSLALTASGSDLRVEILQTPDADRLYADRERLASALDAAAAWEARLASNPQDFDAAWKLACACYWLGGHVPAEDRRRQYER